MFLNGLAIQIVKTTSAQLLDLKPATQDKLEAAHHCF
jgi:hypothetical protein